MKFSRRSFLRGAGVMGIGASRVWAQLETSSHNKSRKAKEGEATISKIRVAQIKVYPDLEKYVL